MYKSCTRCGKVHDTNYKCNHNRYKKDTEARRLRNKSNWHSKSEEIRKASNYLCSVCRAEGIYNYKGLEVHHITPILPLLRKLSCNSLPKQLFANLHRQSIDIIGYAQGSLIFINSFEYKQTEDIVYYVLYVWKQMGMSQQSDQLSLLGESSACQYLNKILKDYIQYIKPLGMPSEAYLLGADVAQTPLDVIALSLCEL